MRRLPLLLVVLAAIALGAATMYRLDNRIQRNTDTLEELNMPTVGYAKIKRDGRYLVLSRRRDEERADFAKRVRAVAEGRESMAHYECSTLTGCDVVGEIEVCTYCDPAWTREQCGEEHEKDKQAFCEEFQCTGGC